MPDNGLPMMTSSSAPRPAPAAPTSRTSPATTRADDATVSEIADASAQ